MTLDRVNTSLDSVLEAKRRLDESTKHRTTYYEELVTAIRNAYGPFTLQQIGDAAGLSRERVRQLLKEEEK